MSPSLQPIADVDVRGTSCRRPAVPLSQKHAVVTAQAGWTRVCAGARCCRGNDVGGDASAAAGLIDLADAGDSTEDLQLQEVRWVPAGLSQSLLPAALESCKLPSRPTLPRLPC